MKSLREEKSGKETNLSSILRLQHLQKLAKWAGVPPSLAALFGHHVAANTEVAGVSLDSSCFLCQRCETMLQPGFNCTIRIEKNVKNKGRRNQSISTSKNIMVYTCHFCSHRNIKWGTPTGHVEGLLSSSLKSNSNSNARHQTTSNQNPQEKILGVLVPNSLLKSITTGKVAANTDNMHIDEKTPDTMATLEKSLSVSKKTRKAGKSQQNSSAGIIDSSRGASVSNKRRRKSWSSLKEITESNDLHKIRNLSHIVIPFHL